MFCVVWGNSAEVVCFWDVWCSKKWFDPLFRCVFVRFGVSEVWSRVSFSKTPVIWVSNGSLGPVGSTLGPFGCFGTRPSDPSKDWTAQWICMQLRILRGSWTSRWLGIQGAFMGSVHRSDSVIDTFFCNKYTLILGSELYCTFFLGGEGKIDTYLLILQKKPQKLDELWWSGWHPVLLLAIGLTEKHRHPNNKRL